MSMENSLVGSNSISKKFSDKQVESKKNRLNFIKKQHSIEQAISRFNWITKKKF